MAGASVRKGKSFERVVANTLGAIYAAHESRAGRTPARVSPGECQGEAGSVREV